MQTSWEVGLFSSRKVLINCLSFILMVAICIFAACSASPVVTITTPTLPSTVAQTPASTPAPPTQTSPPSPTFTQKVSEKRWDAEDSETQTSTSIPSPTFTPTIHIQWFEYSREIPEWPEDPGHIQWLDNNIISVDAFSEAGGNLYNVDSFVVDVSSSSLALMPTSTAFHQAEPGSFFLSPSGKYALLCENDTVQLYRMADDDLLGQHNIKNSQCLVLPSWTQDEAMVVFITHNTVDHEKSVYVWKIDNLSPYIVGKIPESKEVVFPASWSPDNLKIAIYIIDRHSSSPETENIYYIAYTDGRPMRITGVGISNIITIPWLTNEIIDGGGSCCGNCNFHSYYIAETGEYLSEIDWADCGIWHPQVAQLSPDMHWLVLDQTNFDFYDPGVSHFFTNTLFDTWERKTYPLLTSSEMYLVFVGWSEDSTTFYAISRPITETKIEGNEVPFGLLTLDPSERQFRLLDGSMKYAWLSPDRKHLFGYSQRNGGLVGAIYTLKNEFLTPPQPVLDHTILNLELGEGKTLQVRWSNDDSQVAFMDQWGNLWLANTLGTMRKLAANLPTPEQYDLPDFVWSPLDTRLLVQFNQQAWVLYLPKLLRPGDPLLITEINMIDAFTGWAVEVGGCILYTMDGGYTWQNVTPLEEDGALGRFFASSEVNAWVELYSDVHRVVLSTVDGGESWQAIATFPTDATPVSADEISWLDALVGWRLVTNADNTYNFEQTIDGGRTWRLIKIVSWHGPLGFVDENTGWAIAHIEEESALVKTTNGGRTWELVKPVVAPAISK
jgi:photosystem II stability/assembly factor-like uncharacterized protein